MGRAGADAVARRKQPIPLQLRQFTAAAPLAALLLAVTFLGFASAGTVAMLAWDRAAIADGEAWRLLTGHLVHTNEAHLAMNLAGIALAGLLFFRSLDGVLWCVLIVASALCVSGGLYFTQSWPDTYVGLSGVVHALFAAPLMLTAGRSDLPATALFIGLWAKVAYEAIYGGSTISEAMIGIPVVTSAHFFGACSGTLIGAWVRFARTPA